MQENINGRRNSEKLVGDYEKNRKEHAAYGNSEKFKRTSITEGSGL
jgi:hypothetical protein